LLTAENDAAAALTDRVELRLKHSEHFEMLLTADREARGTGCRDAPDGFLRSAE